ncbi:tubby C-terminal domain-like protein [Neobacillus sp. 19]|uniref:tubby C-terminal domain-like protein n=1 Tax=Neobacillus sp. 19 TaxID=3394458 RepID=UPI003BF7172A
MQQFTYQVPFTVAKTTKIPMINKQGDPVFEIQKQPHRFLANIIDSSLRYGLPYCYRISKVNGQRLYSIDSAFPGVRYKLLEYISQSTVPIVSHRVQLIEKAYSFRLDNQEYYFEKDYTNAGYLKCNNKQLATVSMPNGTKILAKKGTIIVTGITEEIAALAAVLYHTFYYYGA